MKNQPPPNPQLDSRDFSSKIVLPLKSRGSNPACGKNKFNNVVMDCSSEQRIAYRPLASSLADTALEVSPFAKLKSFEIFCLIMCVSGPSLENTRAKSGPYCCKDASNGSDTSSGMDATTDSINFMTWLYCTLMVPYPVASLGTNAGGGDALFAGLNKPNTPMRSPSIMMLESN